MLPGRFISDYWGPMLSKRAKIIYGLLMVIACILFVLVLASGFYEIPFFGKIIEDVNNFLIKN
ncbi:MAG: hypothetical protein ABIJ83_02615 [Patescibacteria group bacterium]